MSRRLELFLFGLVIFLVPFGYVAAVESGTDEVIAAELALGIGAICFVLIVGFSALGSKDQNDKGGKK